MRADQGVLPGLALDRPCRQSGDDLPCRDEGEDQRRDRNQAAQRHDLAPVNADVSDVERGRNRQRARGTVGEDQGQDEFVPGDAEGEDGRRCNAGFDQRQHHLVEHLDRTTAVDGGGFFEFFGHLQDETVQQPDRERQIHRNVEQDQAPERVDQAGLAPDHEHRHCQHRQRHGAQQQGDVGHALAPGEAKARQSVGRHAAQHQRDDGGHHAHDQAVGQVALETVFAQHVAVVFQRGDKDEIDASVEDLRLQLQRGCKHQDDRRHAHDRQQDQGAVMQGHQGGMSTHAAAHHRSSSLSGLDRRSANQDRITTTINSNSEMAAALPMRWLTKAVL